MNINTKNARNSLYVAIVFALRSYFWHINAYTEAFPAHTSLMPLKPLMLLLYLAVIFTAFYVVSTYTSKGLGIVLVAVLVVVMGLRMEGKAYLEWLGYREISVGLVSKKCWVFYDPGVNFSAIDLYSNLPVDGFACWSDFTTWQASYYTD